MAHAHGLMRSTSYELRMHVQEEDAELVLPFLAVSTPSSWRVFLVHP